MEGGTSMLSVWMSRSENCWVSEEGNFCLARVTADSVEKGEATAIKGGFFSISKGGDRVEVTDTH